jgi:tRNA pseudouridine38-40 synthase
VNVHATHQMIHFDIPSFWHDVEKLRLSLNERIKPHVYIQKIELVDDAFHARFDAKKRLYRYILYHGTYQPIFANYALHVEQLDVCLINKCAKVFLGKHNFGFFKKSDGGKTKEEREIFKAGAYSHKNFTIIYFLGDAFLRSQIRLMCGFLIKISNKELTIDDLKKQLDRQDRVSTATIPACGLYLSRVYY